MKDCVVIIPIYNVRPTEDEKLSLTRNLRFLWEYDIAFIHPEGMDCGEYETMIEVISDSVGRMLRVSYYGFDSGYFKSNKTYSRMILSKEFYVPFIEYEYMLIAQTDTLILNTGINLRYFIEKGYDYWGAPWPKGPFFKPYSLKDRLKMLCVTHPERCLVGNGGFSLRKISSAYDLVCRRQLLLKTIWRFNEDMFFSYEGVRNPMNYLIAPYEEAMLFAQEETIESAMRSGDVPFAVHAWNKHYSVEKILDILKQVD